ncbi:uncharacterized protein LOC127449159 [Myxocyprinus asiaticus]|uniref:uncharacterized protein LOC127449158 n=1 Tax=Myxocyprinus asiaticus TaxID=70543 RepID=UPI002223AA6B|nr:uncharacterized protein LOC127449158 [Myxocyprinus asiaticus]XP_051568353.1 uncharacterized protein LOC127449159 [Myxocyprinus asiaticus]
MDGFLVNNSEMAGETRRNNDNGLEYRQRAGNRKDGEARKSFETRKYLKEATLIVNVDGANDAKAEDIIKAVTERIGGGTILAVRPRQGKEYELTLEMEEMCDKLIDGLTVKGANCEVKKLQNRDYVVSFMHLPVYLEDEGIIEKLKGWGVFPISKIKRRLYPGTNIEDGTRFVKVRFPREVVSLPYSTKLDTAEGPQYFRVMHSHQVKTCRLCMSPEHLVKDCPDFKCYKCEERGHFARDCNAVKCPECQEFLNKCVCWMEEEEGWGGEQVNGQMHESNNEEERNNEEEQEAEKPQQKETEEETNNGEEREDGKEKESDEEQTQGGDSEWTLMEISSRSKTFLDEMDKEGQREKEQSKETDSEGENTTEEMEKDRAGRGLIRRRSLKVTPNVKTARKKVLKTGLVKCLNRYEALKDLEEEG